MISTALFKKEFLEQWRTNKILIMLAAFFLLGMSGPVTTYFLPELLKNSAASSGLQFTLIKQLTTTDYAVSFIKQLAGIPVLVLVLLAMGAIAGERERGTHILILTKPISRAQFIITKYLTYTVVMIGTIIITALAALYYILLLAKIGTLDLGAYAMLTLTVISTMSFILALVILCSSIFKTAIAAGGVSFIGYIFISTALGLIPDNIGKYLPTNVLSLAPNILDGKTASTELIIPILTGFILSGCVIAASCLIAEKREM